MFYIGVELAIGFIGMCLILFAFLMDQFHKWDSDTPRYDFLNFLGSAMMCYYAIYIQSYPFLGLNLVWALVSLRDLLGEKVFGLKKRKKKNRKFFK